MKIALVFPPYYLESMYDLPPLGLINLATALKSSPHQTVLFDFVLALRQGRLSMGPRIYDECAEMIMEEDPDLVAFSAQCTTYPPVLQIAQRLKEAKKGLRIVIGGHNASFVDRETLVGYPWIDAIVRGEGEITFPELVQAYEKGEPGQGVAGVTFRKGQRIIQNEDRELIKDLDDLPLPDYSFLPPFSEYRDACEIPRSIAILEVGRGCPHKCIYCSESIMWRRRTRTFSVERLVKEMRHLHENFGAECFLLAYDQFTAKRSFVEDFCRRVIEARLNHIPWYCISRLDSVDAPLLGLMREAGCESMCYGIDSGSERTLAFIRKNIDREILYQRVTETTDQGIIPTLSYVIGFPEEQRSDIDETLKLALMTGNLGNSNPLIQLTTILPGTDLYHNYRERIVREVDTYFSLGLEFDQGRRLPGDEDLINGDPAVFSSFYNLTCPARPLRELNLIASYFPIIVNFYPRTFLLLTMELGGSPSELFLQWMDWLAKRTGRDQPTLLPQDCYAHFVPFVQEMLGDGKTPRFRHIHEVAAYETQALEAGKFDLTESSFHIDLHRIGDFSPQINREIILQGFSFDMPHIIAEMKAAIFRESYPKKETFLVFKQEGNHLDVSEINDFGKDFLSLCDGRLSLDEICRQLHGRYGAEMTYEAFYTICLDALQELGKMNLVEPPA
ncbi:MAG: radical SAM protein [Deltaproteobacteria bacterium]|nr:radical SAM protein [Deltaproteobacteria bacterium]